MAETNCWPPPKKCPRNAYVGDHEVLMLNIDQMFDNDSVFGAKISQNIIEPPPEYHFVWAHWRKNHAFVTVSTLKTFIFDILISLSTLTMTFSLDLKCKNSSVFGKYT